MSGKRFTSISGDVLDVFFFSDPTLQKAYLWTLVKFLTIKGTKLSLKKEKEGFTFLELCTIGLNASHKTRNTQIPASYKLAQKMPNYSVKVKRPYKNLNTKFVQYQMKVF